MSIDEDLKFDATKLRFDQIPNHRKILEGLSRYEFHCNRCSFVKFNCDDEFDIPNTEPCVDLHFL